MVRPITFFVAAFGLMLSAMSLSGCATALDGATEDVRIDIAGTGEALCDVTQPGRRYRAYAPSTFRVVKSGDPLKIRCSAPGNREQIVIVDPVVNKNTAYNVATLGIGTAWDYETGALYEYPTRVLIDFTEMPAKGYPLPDYQEVLQRHPGIAGMEQFNPGVAALQSDVGQAAPVLSPRDPNNTGSSEVMAPVASAPGVSSPAPAAATAPAKVLPPIAAPQVLAPGATPAPLAAGTPGVTAQPTTAGATDSGKSSSSMKIFSNKIGTMPSNKTTVTTTTTTTGK